MFSKILIANRGEIAVRIARACSEMGIKSVAVFSDADRLALHARACDEAYYIGPPPATESYLRGDKIIEVARKAGCEAIHPGYGFLSENAAFARAVVDAGLVWIGPPPDAIELMGSKIESKRLAERVGVPTVPGYLGGDGALDTVAAQARRIGYPVLIKASAGGGGKGMRVVEEPDALAESVAAAQREALAAFGDGSILLEKYLSEPRHIEVQVLGDNHGNLVHLGERECSIQRRHQKVLEESPSPIVNDNLRERMTSSALALARAAGYTNAGTVEFIYQDGEYYFLEMNTRLQVEHPVTEEALDIDLVQAQIRVASGEPLWLHQDDILFQAHAMEARLYAEDPEHDFLPSTGTITVLDQLQDARIDTGVARGDSITPYYDPMIAKIVVSGETRQAAINAMREVLGGLQIEGPKTNLDFLRWLVSHPQFEMGNLSTRFIERYYRPGAFPLAPPQVTVAAAALDTIYPGALQAEHDSRGGDPWRASPWRHARQDLQNSLVIEGHTYAATLSAQPGKPGGWWVNVHQGETQVYSGLARLWLKESRREGDNFGDVPPSVQLQFGDDPAVHSVGYSPDWEDAFALRWDGREYWVRKAPAISTESISGALHLANEDTLESPMPGKVLRVFVKEGDHVADDQPLVIIEAMKMEFTVRAPHAGTVARIHFDEGSQVAVGDVLVELQVRADADDAGPAKS
jgi:3-methylcrotonyl-CoA carboxylase alpha subunit